MNNRGARPIFQFLDIYTTPNPPNKAGRILANAGFNASDSNSGLIAVSPNTPIAIMIMVTMLDTAMAIVEITSPSSVPGFTLDAFMAFKAHGALRLEMFPVTKER